MMDNLKRALTMRPYLSTAVIFGALAAIGLFALNWGKSDLQLLLVLYVIVALAVRLDEISRKLGGGQLRGNPHPVDDTLLAKLDEIALSLKTLSRQLAERSESGQVPPPLQGEQPDDDRRP